MLDGPVEVTCEAGGQLSATWGISAYPRPLVLWLREGHVIESLANSPAAGEPAANTPRSSIDSGGPHSSHSQPPTPHSGRSSGSALTLEQVEHIERRVWTQQTDTAITLHIHALDPHTDSGLYSFEMTNEAGHSTFQFVVNVIPSASYASSSNSFVLLCVRVLHILNIINNTLLVLDTFRPKRSILSTADVELELSSNNDPPARVHSRNPSGAALPKRERKVHL